jgi:phenylacetate-CoA ligase
MRKALDPSIARSANRLGLWARDLPLPLRRAYGPLKRHLVKNPIFDSEEFRRTSDWLAQTQWWSVGDLRSLQLERLKRLVRHAFENVPYYRRAFKAANVRPEDIQSLEDLRKLPLVTKQQVRDHCAEFLCSSWDRDSLRMVTTSGSTGVPLCIYQEPLLCDLLERAYMLRQWQSAGYRLYDRCLALRGTTVPRNSRKGLDLLWDLDSSENVLYLSVFHLSEEHMGQYLALIRQFRPLYVQAYPSTIELLARYVARQGIDGIRFTAIFLESETLFPWQRELVESVFQSPVFAGYGMTERVADAVECPAHSGYHENMEYGILELLDADNQPITEPGVVGRVVGTGFDNDCMPLVRYETEDLATYASGDCVCGRKSPRLCSMVGRIRDFVVSRSGHLVSLTSAIGLHSAVVCGARELRYIQDTEGHLIVEVARRSPNEQSDMAAELAQELLERLGSDEFWVDVRYVDQVPHLPNGKVALFDQRLSVDIRDIPNASS